MRGALIAVSASSGQGTNSDSESAITTGTVR